MDLLRGCFSFTGWDAAVELPARAKSLLVRRRLGYESYKTRPPETIPQLSERPNMR